MARLDIARMHDVTWPTNPNSKQSAATFHGRKPSDISPPLQCEAPLRVAEDPDAAINVQQIHRACACRSQPADLKLNHPKADAADETCLLDCHGPGICCKIILGKHAVRPMKRLASRSPPGCPAPQQARLNIHPVAPDSKASGCDQPDARSELHPGRITREGSLPIAAYQRWSKVHVNACPSPAEQGLQTNHIGKQGHGP